MMISELNDGICCCGKSYHVHRNIPGYFTICEQGIIRYVSKDMTVYSYKDALNIR